MLKGQNERLNGIDGNSEVDKVCWLVVYFT